MNDVFEQMKEDLEKTLENMPNDAKELGRALAYICIMMEANKIVLKLIHEHKGDFEK